MKILSMTNIMNPNILINSVNTKTGYCKLLYLLMQMDLYDAGYELEDKLCLMICD